MHIRALRTFAALGSAALLLAACTDGSATDADTTSSSTSAAVSTTGVTSASTTADSGTESSSSSPSGTSSTSTGSATSGGTATTSAEAQVTPVLASITTEPVPVTGTDGRTYLAYEMYLTNITSTPVTVDAVRAVDGTSGDALQSYDSADLLTHSRVVGTAPGGDPATSVVLNGGQLAIVWLDPSVADGDAVPTSLTHQVDLTFAEAPNPLIPAELTENVATTPVRSVPAPVIASPLEGSNWFDGNGCCGEVTAHRGASNPINGRYDFAERFAIDWVQLTSDGKLLDGPANELSSYAYYGAPIHAVADGEIVAVYDELPDETPGANPPVGSLTLAQYGGNHVVQRFEQDGETYYAFYAHLKPGSATAAVKVGQTVKAGEIVGELGNSGNTDSPHLHFHVMDGPDPLASDGLPYQFDTQTVVGQATGTAALDALFTGGALAMATGGPTGERTDAMPIYLDVVDLVPAGGAAAAGSGAGTSTSSPSSSGSSSGATTG